MMGSGQNRLDLLARAYDLCESVGCFLHDYSPKRRFLKCLCCLILRRRLRLLEEALQLHDAACGANAQTALRERICSLDGEARREFRKALVVDVVGATMILACALIVLWPRFSEIVSWTNENLTTPESVVISPPPPAVFTATVAFTITCADPPIHIVQASEPITLSAVNAVFVEPNITPKDWEALTGTLFKLPGEEKMFSYSPSGDGYDTVTFTFTVDERTRSVVTKALPIKIVPDRRGLCHRRDNEK